MGNNSTLLALGSSLLSDNTQNLLAFGDQIIGNKVNNEVTTSLLRDRLIIPDIYNCGCHGTLTKFNLSSDTSGIIWRDNTTTIDFNNGVGVKNLEDNQIIVFEDYDFTDYDKFSFLNPQSYSHESTYYRDNLKFIFKNCLFTAVNQNYEFSSDANISLEFYNCTSNRFVVGNAIVDRCLIGNVTYYQTKDPTFSPAGDPVNPKGALLLKNSYIMDVEASLSESYAAHIDGLQCADPGGHDVNIFNCRFECFDMPYEHSQGGWSYSLFWQGSTINSTAHYNVFHGGGYYGTSIRKAANQELSNNLISGEYHCDEGAPESQWIRACYPNEDLYQMSDGWADYIRTLLVSSVWVEDLKIKICYSNDMHSIRTMRIVTDTNKTYTVSVPACPVRTSAASEGIEKWSDLPFDLITEIDANGINSIRIYDGDTLVRTFNVDTAGSEDSATLGTKSITENGTYLASSDSLDGYSSVTVNVDIPELPQAESESV